jgi:uncharacterized membrane protein YhaH (DUF805 family)
MKWYLGAFKKYVDFRGRARRKEYWFFFLFNIIVSFALAFIDIAMAGGEMGPQAGLGILSIIYALAAFLPGLAVSVRRLHDTNRTGVWILIGLVPLIGPIVLLVFFLMDSDPNENEYGANPKAA